jgi:hypothetical protein
MLTSTAVIKQKRPSFVYDINHVLGLCLHYYIEVINNLISGSKYIWKAQ